MTEVFPWREAPPGDYAVIGDPISHTKSPAMHAAAYRALGLDLTYHAIHVPVGEVNEALNHLRDLAYRGVNATVPHKEAALAWANETTDVARLVGAANTLDLRNCVAHNTDVEGFRDALRYYCDVPGDLTGALVLGAGGASAAVLVGLADTCERIVLWNRSPARARELVARLAANGLTAPVIVSDALPRAREFQIVVNTTSASLAGVDLGIDWSGADPDGFAMDLAYGVGTAPFLSGAERAGLFTGDGRDMLAWQGTDALLWWGVVSDSSVQGEMTGPKRSAEGQRQRQRRTIHKAMAKTLR